ncbi:transcription factor TFIIIB subunit brf1 [Orbilia oligospora]|uniref:B-related factor 1 n=1 Tax=Orbilia oligospora TaxID=2813651 RepID=A0A7C8JUN5_ORBOL|nr:transcription factor TFIIIB subunit brf1 [Orbilia oligospora]KAF3097589.1 transcription factor TFIIIB subunit brf1 [Orbilia oligospora]KAF3098124.1 transcription factor TFIIIB subunit brf1 [Orbilia oligospora]KAF3132784.1 transcription factor TFIIIB subunit brf1 [Orbilia oligospora]KAF3151404.1 transcription factor TFIIIB subunit brf1 [Orbilia oligospora]
MAGPSCPNPSCSNPSVEDIDDKRICTSCGTVVTESFIVSEITFGETSSGAAVVQGSYVGADQKHARSSGPFRRHGAAETREQVISNGRRKLNQLASALSVHDRFVETAARYFTLAVTHNFIQGRKTQHVVACCLYIACRLDKSAHMLIDFSDILQLNVFSLGSTYLKLVKTLNLNIPQLDPELWIRRFARHLEFGDKTQQVCRDAIKIVQRMDRDWIMEGRRPAGVCGAAIIIAARMNNFRRTVTEVVYIVKVAGMTINKRLEEFKNTKSSELTVSEFRNMWLEQYHDPPSFGENKTKKRRRRWVKSVNEDGEVIENEVDESASAPIVDLTAGNFLGPDGRLIGPGTAANAANEKAQKAFGDGAARKRPRVDADGFAIPAIPTTSSPSPYQEVTTVPAPPRPTSPPSAPIISPGSTPHGESPGSPVDKEPNEGPKSPLEAEILALINNPETQTAVEDIRRERLRQQALLPPSTVSADPDNLEDVDDDEIESVMMSPEEVALKTKIWYEYNREYLLTQEAKRLKAEADEKAGIGKKARKKRGKAKPRDSSFPDMPASPAEAAREMMKKKTFSRKINYAALDSLFEDIKTP